MSVRIELDAFVYSEIKMSLRVSVCVCLYVAVFEHIHVHVWSAIVWVDTCLSWFVCGFT